MNMNVKLLVRYLHHRSNLDDFFQLPGSYPYILPISVLGSLSIPSLEKHMRWLTIMESHFLQSRFVVSLFTIFEELF